MKHDIQRTYKHLLFWGVVSNQFDFSTHWLGQCRSYFSSIKARNADPCTNAILTLLARLRSYHQRLIESDAPRTNTQMHQLSNMLEQEADLIASKLFEASIKRVFQRQTGPMEPIQ
ncbi:MAG: DUF6626 family protein [Rhizobiaceae bacterium]